LITGFRCCRNTPSLLCSSFYQRNYDIEKLRKAQAKIFFVTLTHSITQIYIYNMTCKMINFYLAVAIGKKMVARMNYRFMGNYDDNDDDRQRR
jgi:hypothetical protein